MSSAWESSLEKMSVLGTSGAAGEHFGEERVPEGAEHGANLAGTTTERSRSSAA